MNNACRRLVLALMGMGLAAMAAAAIIWCTGGGVRPVHEESARQEFSPNAPNPAESGNAPLMDAMRKLQENPNDAEAMLSAARVLSSQGKAEAALSLARRASIAAPADPRPPHLAGVLLAGMEKWQEAAQELERSLSLKDNPSAHYSAAVIYRYHLQQEEKAKTHFEMAARLCEDPALASMIQAELGK